MMASIDSKVEDIRVKKEKVILECYIIIIIISDENGVVQVAILNKLSK
jgi:hypothetical protein